MPAFFVQFHWLRKQQVGDPARDRGVTCMVIDCQSSSDILKTLSARFSDKIIRIDHRSPSQSTKKPVTT